MRSIVGILSIVVAASVAAPASASTIITSCGGQFEICAVDAEAGKTRTLIARNQAENSRADMGRISRDGSTFAAVVGGQAAGQPFRWRAVAASTSIGAPVGSSADTTTLKDLAPPEPERFWALSLGEDGRNATYGRTVPFREAPPGTAGSLRDIHWVRDGVDGFVGRLPISFVKMAGNRPYHKRTTTGPPFELCEIVPGDPCRIIYSSAENEALTVSPDGRQILVGKFAKAPGEQEVQDGVSVGRASTIDVVDLATRRTLRRIEGATNGVWSPDGRQLAYADVREGRYELVVAPADGALEPRRVGIGLPEAWGGPMPPASESGPPVSTPASARRSSLRRGVRVRVRSVTKGRRVRITLSAAGRRLTSLAVKAPGGSFSRRVRLRGTARRRAARASRITVQVTVGSQSTTETVKLR